MGRVPNITVQVIDENVLYATILHNMQMLL